MSLETKSIKELKDELRSHGADIPDTSRMNIDDAKSLLIDKIKEAKLMSGANPPPPPETTKAAATPQDASALMDMMADMQRQMAKLTENAANKDKEIERLRLEVTTAASGKVSEKSLLQDPAILAALRHIMDKPTNDKGLLRMSYINDDDRIEPVTFFTNKYNQRLHQVIIGGQPIANPLNLDVVRFHNRFRFLSKATGRLETRGDFTTESRAMAEWIRRSNKFGVEIFESTTEMAELSDRSEWADIRDRYLTMLNSKLDAEVDRFADQYSVSRGTGENYTVIRKLVAEKMADAEVNNNRDSLNRRDDLNRSSSIIMKEHLGGLLPVNA